MYKITTSDIWKSNIQNLFENIDEDFISNFRTVNGSNKKLTSWSPVENSSRWFKYFFYSQLEKKDNKFFELYSKINNVDIGKPTSIKYKNLNINLDYYLSIQEFINLTKIEKFTDFKKIVEIGAGFGRTCHVLLTLNNSIEEYVIIDLPQMIELSKSYLKKAIPNNFHKIKFISCEKTKDYSKISSDLVININSFQEMSSETIISYYEAVVNNSSNLYIRNAVCKYSPEQFDIESNNHEDVFNIGLCREIIDIFDEFLLQQMIEKYKKIYSPSPSWKIIFESKDIFPYYYNVIYQKG